jgi:tRNA/tmRNA/rRNA uracil-C5-methylase (TrmA/RlmC/RlmD family)
MSEITEEKQELECGSRVTVTIHDLAFGGEGVARLNDFVIFVPFVIVGEEAEVEIVEVKKRFARARLIQITKKSTHRVEPPCPYFGACGGCQYQHIDYSAQLQMKHKQIVDLFQRIGGVSAPLIDPIIPCPKPYGYRNRIMVRSQWDKPKQGLNIGFLRADSRLVVDIEECKIAEPVLNQQLLGVRANPPPRGGLKVVLRVNPEDWDVPKDSFFQNNFHLLPKLVEVVREKIQESGARHLIDAYCGVGFFSIELADLMESFVGVELDKLAIAAARRNAARHAVSNGEFISGRAEDLLESILARIPPGETALVLDPPRTGCPSDTLRLIQRFRPSQIIYVSCHPATLARDIHLLCEQNIYRLNRVTPLDMFPQTQHVECVADLRLGGSIIDRPELRAEAN